MENIQPNENQSPVSQEDAAPATAPAETPQSADASSPDTLASDAGMSGSTSGAAADEVAVPEAASASEEAPVSEPTGTSAEEGSVGAQPTASLTPDALTPPQPTEAAPTEIASTEATPTEETPVVEAAPAAETTPPAETPPAEPTPVRRSPSMAQVMESDEFSSYMSGADSLQRGALLRGTVVRMDESRGEVLVDVGTKSEGIIARSELGDDEVNVGDEIDVVVLRPEDDDGHPVLSKRRADYEKTWRGIQEAKASNAKLEGTVIKEVKGGLIVNLGVEAFVPASQVDARHRGDLSRFVGRTIPVRVIEIDRKKNKVIASHRQAAEEDRKAREDEVFERLTKGEVVEGIVRRITDFGAFVDIGGIDGLLHVREMGWSRVEHPDQVVKKGQKLQLLVLEVDKERKRVALGLKQLLPDPWKKAAKSYAPGATITGKVVRIAPTCAFVELEEGVEAILPISEMSEERIKTPEDVIAVGQEIEARVKQNQANQRRIVLSLRAAVQDRERRETRQVVREVNTRATGGGSDEGLRLGDVFGSALRTARDRGKERNEQRAVQDRKAAQARALEAADEEEEDYTLDTTDVEDVEDVEEYTEDEDLD